MDDGMVASPLLLYASVLAAYLPGVGVIFASRTALRFPIITFAFLGMFFFNALGSIGVFSPEKIYTIFFDTSAVAEDVALVLILQALLYYIVVLPYVLNRRAPLPPTCPTPGDFLLLGFGIVAMLIPVILYFIETQTFLIFSAVDGSMGLDNSFELRMKAIYGLSNWPLYNIGMVFLPSVISSYALILFNLSNVYRWFSFLAIVVCIAISTLLGSKAGIIMFVVSLGITYGVLLGVSGERVITLLRAKKLFVFTLFSLLLLYAGYMRASGSELGLSQLIERVWYRIFVVGPETIAGAISFVRENGELGISVFPSVRGLLSHEQVNLSLIIHEYIAGSPGGATLPFSAEAFISAKWGGFLAISVFIFLMLIIFQELAFRIKIGVASLAFSAILSYFSVRMMTIGVFATFLNLMYPAVIIAAALLFIFMTFVMNRYRRFKLIDEGRRNANAD